MLTADYKTVFDFNRARSLATLAKIEAEPNAGEILGWRPGPGRAHIGWQLMHLGATEDRYLNVRILGGEAKHPELVTRFAGGSTPDDDVPTPEAIRAYLAETRAAWYAFLDTQPAEAFAVKPYEASPYTLGEVCLLLGWHEGHHQGQVHLTWNLFKNR